MHVVSDVTCNQRATQLPPREEYNYTPVTVSNLIPALNDFPTAAQLTLHQSQSCR